MLLPKTISTARLVLTPLDSKVARSVLDADMSLIVKAVGWPHDDTLDAIGMATVVGGSSLVWLVTLDGVVIGDCGSVGGIDEKGAIEIGYGLAAEHRRRGFGNELVAALSDWLLTQPQVDEVVARGFSRRTSHHGEPWRTRGSTSSAKGAA